MSLKDSEIQALLDCAKALKIHPAELKPENPFSPGHDTPRGNLIKAWLQQNRPLISAKLSQESGHALSLAAVAAEKGLSEHTLETHSEMLLHDPVYAEQHQKKAADWEEQMLKSMEAETDRMAKARGYDREAEPNFAAAGRFRNYFQQNWQNERLQSN